MKYSYKLYYIVFLSVYLYRALNLQQLDAEDMCVSLGSIP
jgi:hypothetical protein